jgi:uncharacterized membrane protein YbhN (UPF0104 family)
MTKAATTAHGASRLTGAAWIFAVLAFGAVVAIVAQRGEIAAVCRLLLHADPRWLLLGCVFQMLTYVMAAGVWQVALRATGQHQPLGSLMELALAMLFGNQAVPSVGLSGGLLVVEALVRRGVPKTAAMSALVLGLVTTYIAFLVALTLTLVLVRESHTSTVIAVGAASAFGLMAGAVTFGIFEFERLPPAWRRRLSHAPIVGTALSGLLTAPVEGLRHGMMVLKATVLQLTEIGFDAATLGVSLIALRSPLAPGAVLSCYVIASVASRVAFAPLGIGTFEAGSVTLLHLAGVALGPALAATLIFRGLTLWLPMLPGLWCARRALRTRPAFHRGA